MLVAVYAAAGDDAQSGTSRGGGRRCGLVAVLVAVLTKRWRLLRRNRLRPWWPEFASIALFQFRLYWRGEDALEGSHLCVRGLVHARTEVVEKDV